MNYFKIKIKKIINFIKINVTYYIKINLSISLSLKCTFNVPLPRALDGQHHSDYLCRFRFRVRHLHCNFINMYMHLMFDNFYMNEYMHGCMIKVPE